MSLLDRLINAAWGAVLGALLGVLGWLLYGLAHSLTYRGPAIDPVLRHWLIWGSLGFGVLGLLMGDRMRELASNCFAAILSFEFEDLRSAPGGVLGMVLMALLLAAIWFTTPTPALSK